MITVRPQGRFTAGRFHLPEHPKGELESRCPYDPTLQHPPFPIGPDDVDEAVVAASWAQRTYGGTSLPERLDGLGRFSVELAKRTHELTATLSRETGRPLWECHREVQGLLSRLELTIRSSQDQLADRSYGDLPARVVSRPLGVVAILGPVMLPLGTSHTHIVAALCAGNAVVWKPSPLCPASAQLYTEALAEARLPNGVFNLVQGGDDVGAALCSKDQVDAIVFTGSCENGQRLRRAVLSAEKRYPKTLHLHLGAKNAAVILEDADVDLAAYEVVTGAYLSAGQRCTAVSRAIVHLSVLDRFLTAALSICATLRIGPPGTSTGGSEPFYGPLLSEDRRKRYLSRLAAATSEQGAQVVLPAERLDRPGWFVSPSIHLVPEATRHPEAPYQRDELFGPDLCIYPVRDVDEAFALCEDNPHGLCASIFSETPLRWKRFTEEVRAGALFWNRSSLAPSGLLPFGGTKRSGYGGRGGADAVLSLRREVSLFGRGQEGFVPLPGTLQLDLQEKANA